MSDSEKPAKSKSSTVHSVVVAVNLLEYLAESGRPQRVTDIAAHLGMTKARVSPGFEAVPSRKRRARSI